MTALRISSDRLQPSPTATFAAPPAQPKDALPPPAGLLTPIRVVATSLALGLAWAATLGIQEICGSAMKDAGKEPMPVANQMAVAVGLAAALYPAFAYNPLLALGLQRLQTGFDWLRGKATSIPRHSASTDDLATQVWAIHRQGRAVDHKLEARYAEVKAAKTRGEDPAFLQPTIDALLEERATLQDKAEGLTRQWSAKLDDL